MRKEWLSVPLLLAVLVSGCASVPMGSDQRDEALKQFPAPPAGESALYIFRDSNFGASLKKTIMVDGTPIGESARKVYFYQVVEPGEHTISTESEFSDNSIVVDASEGRNHFIRQYIKLGAFVGGANLEEVDEKEGRQGVLSSNLAQGW